MLLYLIFDLFGDNPTKYDGNSKKGGFKKHSTPNNARTREHVIVVGNKNR